MHTASTRFLAPADTAGIDYDLTARSEISRIFRNYKRAFEDTAKFVLAISPAEPFQPPTRRSNFQVVRGSHRLGSE